MHHFTLTALLGATLLLILMPLPSEAVQRRGAKAIVREKTDSIRVKKAAPGKATTQEAPEAEVAAAPPVILRQGPFLVDTSGGVKKYWLGNFGFADHEVYDRTGMVELGLNLFMTPKPYFFRSWKTDQISNMGFWLGFDLPVRIPLVLCMYRVKIFLHDATRVDEITGKKVPKVPITYAAANNEIMIGKTLLFRNSPFEPVPFVGVGFTNSIIMPEVAKAKYFTTWSIGIMLKKRFTRKNFHSTLGILYAFENAFIADEDDKTRTNISFFYAY